MDHSSPVALYYLWWVEIAGGVLYAYDAVPAEWKIFTQADIGYISWAVPQALFGSRPLDGWTEQVCVCQGWTCHQRESVASDIPGKRVFRDST